MKKKPTTPTSDPYSELGVPRDADTATVKRAFRSKAKVHHPDVRGGDGESFIPIQRAYDILSDPARRARYDQFGDDGSVDVATEASKTFATIVKHVVEATETKDLRHANIIGLARIYIQKQQVLGTEEIKKFKRKILHWQEAIRRTKTKKDDFTLLAFQAEITNLENSIKGIEFDLELSRAMITLSEDYHYTVDKFEEPSFKNNYGMKLNFTND